MQGGEEEEGNGGLEREEKGQNWEMGGGERTKRTGWGGGRGKDWLGEGGGGGGGEVVK